MDAITRALDRLYNPPIRGRNSRKRRIRKKAEKRYYNLPFQRALRDPIQLISRIPPGDWYVRVPYALTTI